MDNILLNIVRQLRVLLRDVFGVHYLEVPTVDQHDAEEGIILQYFDDLNVDTTDKLVLIDAEI